MKDNKSNSIYSVKEQEYVDEPDLPAVDYWRVQRRNNMLKNIFWALVFIGVAGGIAWILIANSREKTDMPESKWLSSPFQERVKEHVMHFQGKAEEGESPEMEIFVDEMISIHPDKKPVGGQATLNAAWLKQAAYYLVSAERSAAAGKFDDALRQYKNVLDIYPDIEGVHARIGYLLLRSEDYAAAVTELKQALGESDVDPETINNLGSAYMALDEYEKAVKCFNKVLQINDEHDTSLVNIAHSYEKLGKFSEAQMYYEKYIKRHADDTSAYMGYANLLLEMQEWKKAVGVLMQLQQKAPDVGPVYFKLAEALSHTGNRQGAMQSLKRGVLLVDPRNALGWLVQPGFDDMRNLSEFKVLVDTLSRSE
ncbi:MAG: tetratricopeptide repeat protein [Spartobacteria bacterium]|nr:tetratricopeptide repeat protein [Spartobacteria bacterium]